MAETPAAKPSKPSIRLTALVIPTNHKKVTGTPKNPMPVNPKIAHWAYVMENGRVTLEGPVETLLANEDVKKAYLGI